jgi:hypothetical protein
VRGSWADTMPAMTSPAVAVARPSLRRDVWCGLAVVLLAMLIRAPRMSQSLWMDEMTTLADYVLQPWSKVLAGRTGEYVPNNHVLHTVLAKLAYDGLAGGRAAAEAEPERPPAEAVLRLPALSAGCLLPVALAWPLRRRAALAALAVAVLAAVHPWLVDLGAEARGYTLMLLLGVAATNLLPAATGRRGWGYAVALALAIYTIPLAVLLVPAHAVAVWATRRGGLRQWAIGAAGGLVLASALYLPMVHGLISYYRRPYPAADYRSFLDSLPRHVLTGQRLPRQTFDPALPPGLDHLPDPPGSAVFWALPVLVVTVGTALAWPRFPDARPLLATLGTVSALGVLLPLAVPGAAEVRFVIWAVPWFCLTAALLLTATADLCTPVGGAVPGRALAAAAGALLLVLMLRWDVEMLPNQQVREAVAVADRLAPPGGPIVVAYVGDLETTALYGEEAPRHAVLPAYDAAAFERVTSSARAADGRLPWVVVLFEGLARDRGRSDPTIGGLWRDIATHYRLVARLDGRVSPVAIYAPRDDGGRPGVPVVNLQ